MSRFVLLLLLLAACATPPLSIPVIESGTEVAIPQPSPISVKPVHWQIIDSAALQKMAADLTAKPNQQFVIYVLDTSNFTALTLNLNELRRYIEQQKEALKFATAVIKQNNDTATPQSTPQK